MNRMILLPVFLAVTLLAGCVFESYRPVAEFDLVTGEVEPPVCALRILEFRNNSTSGIRLQWRDPSGRVIRDPYNKWVLPPEQLVARALNLALLRPDEQSVTPLPVEGTLEEFEVDGSAHQFRLTGSWKPPRGDREFRFSFSVPVEEDSADAVARAAGEAVRRLAGQLSQWSRAENRSGE